MRIAILTALLALSAIVAHAADAPPSRPPDMASRHLEGNVLVSPSQPKIRITVDKAFTALPTLEFPIRRDTWVERWCFVDAGADRVVHRLVIVQLEHAQAGSTFRFLYPSKPPMQWGSAVYRHGTFLGDDSAEIARDPELEVAQTHRLLASKGYKAGNGWNVARLARVADADGKSEIIVFYEEATTAPAPKSADDDAGLPADVAEGLFARMKAAVASD